MTGSLIFITGGTGFIGSHVIDATLRAGYRVRLGIRKPEQAQTVTNRYPKYALNIETVVIPDMSKPEAFKSAFNSVDFIFHLASPMPGSGSNVRTEYVNPAVQATEAVLNAAMDFPQIKKIVLMSSALALMPVDALFTKEASVKGRSAKSFCFDSPFLDLLS
jgi:nucleoside-diphosphate-sugar epimerase